MTFLKDLLYACVLLYVGSSFYKSVDCALVVTPENVAAISGENVTLSCASDQKVKDIIVWGAINLGSTITHNIYTSGLNKNVSSYIYVDDTDDGSCNLTITASNIAAKRYVCIESSTGSEASAELIVLEKSYWNCKLKGDNSARADCTMTIISTGNWAPQLECDQWNDDKKYIRIPGNKSKRADNDAIVSSWTYSTKKSLYDLSINCSATFSATDKPQETTAQNIPTGNMPSLDFKVPLPSDLRPLNTPDKSVVIAVAIALSVLIAIFAIATGVLYKRYKAKASLGSLRRKLSFLAKTDYEGNYSNMMTDMKLTPISNLRSLKSLDQIHYPDEDLAGNITSALVIKIINDETVEILKLPTNDSGKTLSSQLKDYKSFQMTYTNVDLGKYAQDEKLYRVDYDRKAPRRKTR